MRSQQGSRGAGEIFMFPSSYPAPFPLFSLRESGYSQSNHLNLKPKSLISLIILLIMSVDNSVDKLWISCGRTCGKLGLRHPLWIAVDKLTSYPQGKASYPQNCPQAIFRPRRQNYHFSTFSTGPTIIVSNLKKF
jgi:hypothetical protein